MDLSFFTLADPDDPAGALLPTPISRSAWRDDQMHGVAISGALARTAERTVRALGRDDLHPARFTVDLFRPARTEACTLRAEVAREGPRICLVDVVLEQQGERVARASAVFLAPTESAPGEVWTPADRPRPPTADEVPVADGPRVPFFRSADGWSQDFGAHQNAARKASWNAPMPVVAGEDPTPFQLVAAYADQGSMVSHWGTNGVEHINTDITLALSREPSSPEVGLVALERSEHLGVAVGPCLVLDREGVIGTVATTALANTRRTVDFATRAYGVEGERPSS